MRTGDFEVGMLTNMTKVGRGCIEIWRTRDCVHNWRLFEAESIECRYLEEVILGLDKSERDFWR